MLEREELKVWFDREITQPEHMEASLRYAVVLPIDSLGRSAFTFPWYKKINGEPYFLHFRRRRPFYPLQIFSLDLGQIREGEESKEKIFNSFSWRDFGIVRADSHLSQELGIPEGILIGEGAREENNYNSHSFYVRRPMERYPWGHWGVYVSPALRRQKIGTALISAARIILDQVGVETLVLDEVEEIEEGKPRRCFHESLGGYFFDVREGYAMYTYQKTTYGKVAYPAKATQHCPYRFE